MVRHRGYYLTDIRSLNEVYQAAKAALIHPDKFTLGRLAQAVARAEEPCAAATLTPAISHQGRGG
jgi:hypothetical protein